MADRKTNPFGTRLEALQGKIAGRGLDAGLVCGQSNIRSLTGIDCDNACLFVTPSSCVFYTDFRYTASVNRTAPWIKTGNIKKLDGKKPFSSRKFAKVGFESSVTFKKHGLFQKAFPGAELVDIADDVLDLRMVKTAEELARIRAAAALNDLIWAEARKQFKPGMTERQMALEIKRLMLEKGDGEAFETIVCVGKNAAECHHVPDSTVWNGRESVLVDMGVKLDGYCSDMTRNILPVRPSPLYRKVYSLVLEANERAIRAARPGMTAGALDRTARDFLARNGMGKAFGHSLGHGVGIDIHEKPFAAKKQKTVLKSGMTVTIEPGVYLEGNLGVRIEDLAFITDDGCEVVSHSDKPAYGKKRTVEISN